MRRSIFIIALCVGVADFINAQENTNIDTNNIAHLQQQDLGEAYKYWSDLLSGWSVGLNYGLTQFNGDIKSESFISKTEINSMLIVYADKKINNLINLNTQFGIGRLNGSRLDHTYSISETTTSEVHDPYANYEGQGEKFSAEIYEIAIVSKIDLQEVYIYFKPYFQRKKNIHFYFNLGYGEVLYTSMKRNIQSGTYIYAIGYDDLNENYESYNRVVRSALFVYGASIEYNISENISLELSTVSRLSFTDHLDASGMKSIPLNDSYRVMSFGMKYIF